MAATLSDGQGAGVGADVIRYLRYLGVAQGGAAQPLDGRRGDAIGPVGAAHNAVGQGPAAGHRADIVSAAAGGQPRVAEAA